jgi:phosphatidylserine/phosphatidylglycerophosphate/cardiolipin synthase-like enzyme
MARVVCALGPDSAGTLLTDLIDSAQVRLDAAMYEVGPSYARILAAAAAGGVALRVLLDAHAGANASSARRLARGSGRCRVLGGQPGSEAHWKLLVADASRVAVGTGNLIRRDAPLNPIPPGRPEDARPGTREWWAIVEGAPRLLRQAAEVFDAAWREAGAAPSAWAAAAAQPPVVGVPRPLAAPLELDVADDRLELVFGGGDIAGFLAAALERARTRVVCTLPYVHCTTRPVRALLAALAAAAARGVDVRLLLGTPPAPEDATALTELRALSIRVMDPLRSTTGHAKGVVADGMVIITSANWSAAGLGGNREAALVIEDDRAAAYYADAQTRDWEVAAKLG